MRQMTLVAFLQAQNCTNLPSSWRHPQSRTDTWSADYYRHIGRVLEEGKFHLGFFDDRLSMPDMYGRDHAHTVKHGIRCVKLDGEAQNMGRDEVVAHDERYDHADEFMAVVLGHWDSWEDGAIVQDKAAGLF